ncbi:hypothetical protein ONS95_011981 [Cadophora gregata]|uniref:uncharacterized protein n=1 Tax=Cadophora gregata TaxID=51156 RepID=UPI0026DB2B17|nr:uncharacterized protein ONS95_011981 [Cadophora gregata]KAK0117649.1 hypothetical protein ONS95_011981 [Cadophora gregata]KAK0122699.1 hypothetical protein ONS96_009734 [Cadophora gregata f. sp. sojae]
MVAIQSVLTVLAMTALVKAAPQPGQSVATYRFFNLPGCDFGGNDQRKTLTAIVPGGSAPSQPEQRLVGTCFSEDAYASVTILNIEPGCQWEQHTEGCTGTPLAIKNNNNPPCLTVDGAAPRNFYKITCR